MVTRRQLAQWAMGQAALPAQSKYTGALDGSEGKVDAAAFDPVRYTLGLLDATPPRLSFRAQHRKKAEAWQRQLRTKLRELLGGFPAGRAALQPQTLEVREFPTYRREKFVFQSRPGLYVLGYLVTPTTDQAPYPAVVCIPGHGRGVDDIVGIDAQGSDRAMKEGYQYDFALQVAEHGMAAVAIEPLAFGCRRDPVTKRKGLTAYACQPVAGSALLLGQTLLGWRVYEVMRAIDWIETRTGLDARRVGCVGISGGGACTIFAAALELRIRAAVVSGYLSTYRDTMMSVSHCIDNYVPGLLTWAEMHDIAGLIAPRPLFVESGTRDDLFPITASRASFARVKQVYEIFGAAGSIEQETFDGPHRFWGVKGLPFLAKNLGVRSGAAA